MDKIYFMLKGVKLGLALGGGASRGLAHIGVLEVLEERGIEVDIFSGTSMGALISAVYLQEGTAKKLRQIVQGFLISDEFKKARFDLLKEKSEDQEEGFFDSVAQTLRKGILYSYSLRRESIITREVFNQIVNSLIKDINIEDLPKPFCAVSLDVASGEEVVWTKGSLRQAVLASSAIPGFFPPQIIDDRVLVDGGWTNSVPIRPARALGAEVVIAVDTSRGIEEMFQHKRGVDLILRTASIMMKRLREFQLEEADLVIQPAVTHIHWADFDSPMELITRGRDEAIIKLSELAEVVKRYRRARRWKVFVPSFIRKSLDYMSGTKK